MAKKSSGGSAAAQIQRIASQTQVQLQKMVNSSNELQSRYNAAEAQKSRDWQTQMSKTAHQMEVEDLKKAGLNPVLSSGGSGAQSYTTSSASVNPESGASAAAGVQEAQIGSIGNMEASRIAAAATKQAAAVSAAAMRSAAAQSAAAQMYAANMGYKGKQLDAFTGVLKSKISAGAQVKVAQIGRGKSFAGLIDKWIEGSGLGSSGRSILKRVVGTTFAGAAKLASNPKKYYQESYLLQHAKNGVAKPSYNALNSVGKQQLNNSLRRMGLTVNASNRQKLFNAVVLKKQSSVNSICSAVYRNNRPQRIVSPTSTANSHKTRRNIR